MSTPDFDITGLAEGFKVVDPVNSNPEPAPADPANPPAGDPPTPVLETLIENHPPASADPNKPAEAPKPVIDESEFLKNIFGDGHPYKSIEEVKAIGIGERLRELQGLKEEHVRAKSEVEKFRGKVSLMESPQFLNATKYAHFANELKADGVEIDYHTFQKLSSFDAEKLTDLDKLVLLDYVKYGAAGRSRDEIMQSYRLGDFAEIPEGKDEKVESEVDKKAMRREALAAGKELSTYRQKIDAYKPEFQDATIDREANLKKWEGSADKITQFFTSLAFPSYEKKDYGIKVDSVYTFTAEDHAEIKKEWQKEVEARNLPLTQESAEVIYESVLNTMRTRKMNTAFAIQGDKIVAAIDMALKAKYSNFKGLDVTPERKAPPEKKLPEGVKSADQLLDEMLKRGR